MLRFTVQRDETVVGQSQVTLSQIFNAKEHTIKFKLEDGSALITVVKAEQTDGGGWSAKKGFFDAIADGWQINL